MGLILSPIIFVNKLGEVKALSYALLVVVVFITLTCMLKVGEWGPPVSETLSETEYFTWSGMTVAAMMNSINVFCGAQFYH